MAVAGSFYRSFANSFTLCLIGSFVFQTLLAVRRSDYASLQGTCAARRGWWEKQPQRRFANSNRY
jgi:hypothetical protein